LHKQKKAYFYVALSILLWSTVASAFKLSLKEVDYLQLLFYASLTSFFTLFIINACKGYFSALIRQDCREYLKSAGLALINPLAYYCLLFKAYSILPAQEAQPLNWTWPIVLAILSVFFLKQKLGSKGIFAVLISFSGVVIIATRGDFGSIRLNNLTGAFLAVSSSLLWALFWLLNLLDKREPLIKLTSCFFFGAIYSAIVVAIFSHLALDTITAYFGTVYVGLFEMGVTFILWLKALSLAKNSASMAVCAYLTPFVSLIFIHFLLGEKIMLASLAGLILIIGGILLISYDSISKK